MMRRWPWLLPFLAALALLLAGVKATWFLCDDAFIAFRYIGNAHDGHGLVWNLPPFAPVEGYTSFLWVLVLYVTWSVTGIAPPQSANTIAVLCASLTLLLVARRLAILPLPEPCERWRPWLAMAVLLGIAGNHTFATWATSGLETAMFGLWAVAWTLVAVHARAVWSARDVASLSALASLAAMTRPDGALLALATLAIVVHALFRRLVAMRSVLLGLVPFVVPAVHLLWRHATYGEWVPNTYYAKVVAAWPASGLRYLFCFGCEHGLWLWLPLALVWGIVTARRPGALRSFCGERFAGLVAVGTWVAFVGYYTLVAGGDHFAYRPFAHLIPLLFLAALAMVTSLSVPPRLALIGMCFFAVSANTFGWWYDHALRGRESDGFVRVSTALPAPFGALFRPWERCQAWLRLRYVALPRALHATMCADLLRLLPERRPGQVQGLAAGQLGVYRTVAAGVVSWSLADVAMLDAVGLNDWVVAHNPAPVPSPKFAAAALRSLFPQFDLDHDGRLSGEELAAAAHAWHFAAVTGVLVHDAAWGDLLLALCDRDGDGLDVEEFAAAVDELGNQRHMAHERTPPAGYLEALRPNVRLDGEHFVVVPGVAPLTDAEIVQVEAEYRAKVRAAQR